MDIAHRIHTEMDEDDRINGTLARCCSVGFNLSAPPTSCTSTITYPGCSLEGSAILAGTASRMSST